MSLRGLTEFINELGLNEDLLIGSGGNASFKNDTELFITPSGAVLSQINENDYLKLNRAALQQIFMTCGSVNKGAMKHVLTGALEEFSQNIPSIDTLFHEIMDFPFIIHLHPTKVNALTCSADGSRICSEIFPEALWIEKYSIGSDLAVEIKNAGKKANAIFLKNHGLILAGNSVDEIKSTLDKIISTLDKRLNSNNISTFGSPDKDTVLDVAPILRSLLREDERKTIIPLPYLNIYNCALTPEHYIFLDREVLEVDEISDLEAKVNAFKNKFSQLPTVVSVKNKVTFCSAPTYAKAKLASEYLIDAYKIEKYADAFGGVITFNNNDLLYIDSILKVNNIPSPCPLYGKIAVVTGGAQGFGFGITEGLVQKGVTVAIADLNLEGALKAAEELNEKYGKNKVFALKVNIADEESVKNMIDELVMNCGGLDLFVANAGVLKAGSVKTFDKKDWEFVTNINYTGYYLCVKYCSKIMSLQNNAGGSWSDIVQINSKSGLEGSNKNAAYAGSKFGTIGLTQSFALELVDDKIKVNSVCPGNFFDGPLWSDPERGLFVQYLNSNKVPGAKSIEDVKRFYEAKVPMNRGCFPSDVVKAIIYCVSQQYETGQAVPVSGGQVMLN
jgi:NAD(P)-dependent dehydrogenase (short-subunit alcohol dehydrogenase family)/rhamnose utilization protein RhaD (predicted bifunctional aldolase and dehydrogenase)